jgi:hypothetical protein
MLANQVAKLGTNVMRSSQAQARLLVKVVEQNEVQATILGRVEQQVASFSPADLKATFAELSNEFKTLSSVDKQEMRDIWSRNMIELGEIVRENQEETSAKLTTHMRQWEQSLATKLTRLDVNAEKVLKRVQDVKEQLVQAAEARKNGDEQAEQHLQLILAEFNQLRTQLDRVEQVSGKILSDLGGGLVAVRKQLEENEEGLAAFKSLWVKKVKDLEVAIDSGGENLVAVIEKCMKNTEKLIAVYLDDLDLDKDALHDQLQDIKLQLCSAAEDRVQGEKRADDRLNLIMSELKELHLQLDRVESVSLKIFHGMEASFMAVRNELSTNAEGLSEFRGVWERKLLHLEKSISTVGENAVGEIEKQMKKVQNMLDATLADLDIDSEHVLQELALVREQLKTAASDRAAGVEGSEARMNMLVDELRGMQLQLTEVLLLQGDSARSLAEVSCVFDVLIGAKKS